MISLTYDPCYQKYDKSFKLCRGSLLSRLMRAWLRLRVFCLSLLNEICSAIGTWLTLALERKARSVTNENEMLPFFLLMLQLLFFFYGCWYQICGAALLLQHAWIVMIHDHSLVNHLLLLFQDFFFRAWLWKKKSSSMELFSSLVIENRFLTKQMQFIV